MGSRSTNSKKQELWIRYTGPTHAILEHVNKLERMLGIRLYPSEPKPDNMRPGLFRVYLKIPIEEVDDDE